MAARKQIQLTIADRDAVSNGLRTLADLAETLGCSRQSLHITFKRKGWPTKPIDLDDGEHQVLAPAGDEPAVSAAQKPVRRRRARQAYSLSPTSCEAKATAGGEVDLLTSAPTAPIGAQSALQASSAGPAQGAPPGASVAPIGDDLGEGGELAAESVAEHARRAAAAIALAALDRAAEILSKPVGATALKATIAAVSLAIGQLAQAGFGIETEAQGAPRLTIREMSAERMAEIQAEVEAAYRGEMSGDSEC